MVRRGHLAIDVGILGIGIFVALGTVFFPSVLDIRSPALLALATIGLFAIGAYAFWNDYRTLLRINSVSVATGGLHPPFKPKQRLQKGDWFLPYKDILSMLPVAEKGDLVPVYDLKLRDNLTFQLNALDLLVYVGETEVRRYARILAVIREEIQRPVNRERAARGNDVMIPAERFHDT
ncbi:MAG: hypothetical protein E6K03_00120 [Methanobacteriota archaeon]|nr:MAG: hypothetical protein E6K03_00120 [Euryarchaeota archaeon]